MKELKYCCEEFKFRCVDLKDNQHPNIRLIKLTNPIFHRLIGNEKKREKKRILSKFTFALTEGYEKFDFIKSPGFLMDYCPFCGMDLHKFYKDDAYANEIQGITFDIK